ncbi:MAG: hypothetical protein HRT57_16655 [Crocinitomicaceae bacterium]|nr:hypothetical protein [Crocinitomicaceae bacterium]
MKIKAAMVVVKNHTLEEVDAYFYRPLKFETDSDLIDDVPQKEFMLRVPVKLRGYTSMMSIPSIISTVESEDGVDVICSCNVNRILKMVSIGSLVPALFLVAIYGGSESSIAYAAILYLLLIGASFVVIQSSLSGRAEDYLRAVLLGPDDTK